MAEPGEVVGSAYELGGRVAEAAGEGLKGLAEGLRVRRAHAKKKSGKASSKKASKKAGKKAADKKTRAGGKGGGGRGRKRSGSGPAAKARSSGG